MRITVGVLMALAAIPALPTIALGQDGVGLFRAITEARTIEIPQCTLFVDGSAGASGAGTIDHPYQTIAAAVESAESGAIICVAEGDYAEQIAVGEKAFTLAGGFRSGSDFSERDSAAYVSRAIGDGTGSFLRVVDPGPTGDALNAVDGFEITGYSQALLRDFYISQRFDITNNYIHDNTCTAPGMAGAGFALSNVTATISGNVLRNNVCDRGGAGFYYDAVQDNALLVEGNLVEANSGVEPDSNSHGGALYLFGKELTVIGNTFIDNSVTGWGAGLYLGAFDAGGLFTTAKLSYNFYRGNSAGIAGGGMFCDDGATCFSDHEIYYANCGSNILLDGGYNGSGPTTAHFDHLTNVGALGVGCTGPGPGVRFDKGNVADDAYSFVNSLFWDNGPELDFAPSCQLACDQISISVDSTMAQQGFVDLGAAITFGEGMLEPVDPLFADPEGGDFHLRSEGGRWTADGIVTDAETSVAILAGGDAELGAYGDTPEASLAQ